MEFCKKKKKGIFLTYSLPRGISVNYRFVEGCFVRFKGLGFLRGFPANVGAYS